MTIKNGKIVVWFEYDTEIIQSEQDIIWALENAGLEPSDWDLELEDG